jgi:hypothetical protein
MSVNYNPRVVNNGLVLYLDAANKKSWSQNFHPYPLDIGAWATTAENATLSRDPTVTDSPTGGVPLKMVGTGLSAQTITSGSLVWTLAPVAIVDTITASVWVKASVNTSVCLFLYGVNSSGSTAVSSGRTPSIYTYWSKISHTLILNGATTTVVGIQTRLWGPFAANASGITFWWDGLQVERASQPTQFNSITNINGTQWNDVSRTISQGTMYGQVPYDTDGGGCFNFSTVSGATAPTASMGFTFTSNTIPTTGSFTFSTWIKNPPAGGGQTQLFGNAGSADGFRFGVRLDAVYVLIGGAGGVGYSEPVLPFLSPLSATLWYNVAVVYDRQGTYSSGAAQWRLYLNGILQNTTNMVAGQPAFTNTAPGIVCGPAAGSLYTGKLALLTAHNRALSETEIIQNFNALRGRFSV